MYKTQQQLVAGITQKHRAAYDHVYRAYGVLLYRCIHGITQNESRSNTVLQQVFEHTWKNIAQYNPADGCLYMWMHGVARSKAMVADKEYHKTMYRFG